MEQRQSSFTFEEILTCSRGEMFGPGNPQLPLPPMLMLDRITEVSEDGGDNGKGHIRAEYDITPERWFFDCHFAGDPVMPGCLGLDALWQMTGFYLGWLGCEGKGRAISVGEIRFAVVPLGNESYRDFHQSCRKREITPCSRIVTGVEDVSR